MIGSFRNFAKTKLAGVFVFIMIIPFVFWGMGSMFSSGNTNTIVKINQSNVSTEEFFDYLNNSGIPTDTIRENLNDNIKPLEIPTSGAAGDATTDTSCGSHLVARKALFPSISRSSISKMR